MSVSEFLAGADILKGIVGCHQSDLVGWRHEVLEGTNHFFCAFLPGRVGFKPAGRDVAHDEGSHVATKGHSYLTV